MRRVHCYRKLARASERVTQKCTPTVHSGSQLTKGKDCATEHRKITEAQGGECAKFTGKRQTVLRAERGVMDGLPVPGTELERLLGVDDTPTQRPREPPKRAKLGVLDSFSPASPDSSVRGFLANDLNGVVDAPALCARFFSSLLSPALPETLARSAPPDHAAPFCAFDCQLPSPSDERCPSTETRVRAETGASSPAAAVATVLPAISVSSASFPLNPASAIMLSVSFEFCLLPPADAPLAADFGADAARVCSGAFSFSAVDSTAVSTTTSAGACSATGSSGLPCCGSPEPSCFCDSEPSSQAATWSSSCCAVTC